MEHLSFTSVLRHISEIFLSLNNILSYYLLIANYTLSIPSQVSPWNPYNVVFIICILWLRKEGEKLHKLPQNHIINGMVEMGSCSSQHSKHRLLIVILFCLKLNPLEEVSSQSSYSAILDSPLPCLVKRTSYVSAQYPYSEEFFPTSFFFLFFWDRKKCYCI